MSNRKKDIIFLLGSGFNQELRDFDDLKPPMANNFFQLIKKSSKYTDFYQRYLNPVYEFIQQYWKINEEELSRIDFNLEELFTYLQLKINEIWDSEDSREYVELDPLMKTDNFLTMGLITFLQGFPIHSIRSSLYTDFGRKIWKIKPIFVTFNYDMILEQILQFASGVNPNIPDSHQNAHEFEDFNLPDELIRYSHYNYNIPLTYGFKFNIIKFYMSGIPKYELGEKFYRLNALYDNSILKLHGSLNWAKVKRIPVHRPSLLELDNNIVGKIIVSDLYWDLKHDNEFRGWKVFPHIITPVMYKSKFYDQFPFIEIWREAKNRLSNCKKLIVIGYSFPPTDFHTKKLFLDSFKENELEDLIVINPDTSVIEKIKNLTHFNRPVTICSNLREFMNAFDDLFN